MKVFILILLNLFSLKSFSIDTVATGFRVSGSGGDKVIDAHGTCHKVINANVQDIFVPTKTSAEWSSFYNNLPSGVTLDSCVASGYFVMTNDSWNGDLGSINGANSRCLTDLQTYSWKGKGSVTLNASTVKAFLCDSVVCNNLDPSTNYIFAKSGDASAGGASFTTNASGVGVGDTSLWDDITHFNGNYTWWSNRGEDGTNTATHWATIPHSGNTCSEWTYGAASPPWAARGRTNIGDERRWEAGSANCNSLNRMICFVNPTP